MQDDTHARPSVVSRFFTRMRQNYQRLLDYWTPQPSVRSARCQEISSDNGIIKSAGPAIDRLSDPLLAEIFSHLPLKDRYQLRLVSRRWDGAFRDRWTDITRLSLNSIPRAMVNPVLGLCPKIEAIYAKDLIILLEHKPSLSTNENVQFMKLRNVKFALPDLAAPSCRDVFFSFAQHLDRFPNLDMLILHNVGFLPVRNASGDDSFQGFTYAFPRSTALSLRCLVFSYTASPDAGHLTFTAWEWENLQCLYLDHKYTHLHNVGSPLKLPQLCELCVIGNDFTDFAKAMAAGGYPKLEVLVYASDYSIEPTALGQVITANSALRILAIAGKDWKLALMRRRQERSNGFYAPNQFPVRLPAHNFLPHQISATRSRAPPPLHIFVGGDFTNNVRFTLPPSDTAKFWYIDCPMPEYLAKPEVAAVFKDVVVAEIIRKGPEIGLKPWGHPDKTELFYSTEQLLFR